MSSTSISIPKMWATMLLLALHLSLLVEAYVPAVSINDTSSLNLSDSSTIAIAWQNPRGTYLGYVSYQLEADIPTNGTTSGALVHFTEESMGPNRTSTTPWIAFISCDQNETMASNEWDIFTLARDRGAVSALLYTTTSSSCLLNQHYIQDFEKPLDVFATKTVQVARLIQNQFRHTNDTFYTYNGDLLNSTFYGELVNTTLAGQSASFNQSSYLAGTLTARNSTGNATPTDIPNGTSTPSPSNGRSGLPASMVVLYVVTGLIGTCFVTMLVLGWRRARRHPEVYGGRAGEEGEGGPGGHGRPTAAGIAQAMLDTFPVIKFRSDKARGNGGRPVQSRNGSSSTAKEVDGEGHGHGHGGGFDMNEIHLPTVPERGGRAQREEGIGRVRSTSGISAGDKNGNGNAANRGSVVRSMRSDDTRSFHSALEGQYGIGMGEGEEKDGWTATRYRPASAIASSSNTRSRPVSGDLDGIPYAQPLESHGAQEVREGGGLLDGNGDADPDTCPICLLEFEEGDDLRVLPCEREHMYHQTCIDPWLLRVSGSCPLCRKDFNAPPTAPSNASIAETDPATGSGHGTGIEHEPGNEDSYGDPTGAENNASSPSGFARYLSTMRNKVRTRRRRAGTGATASSSNGGLLAAEDGQGQGYSSQQLEGGGAGVRDRDRDRGRNSREEVIDSIVWGTGYPARG